MKTKRLTIKNVELSDTPNLATWTNKTLETIEKEITNNNAPYYIFTITETNTPIGYIRLNWLDDNETCARLQFGLGSHKGEGYTKEALETLIPNLFAGGVHRLESEVYSFNQSSYKLLKAIGFDLEGTRRQSYYHDGAYHDVHLFAIIQRTPSTELQDYLNYVTPYYHNPETLNFITKNLEKFNINQLNHPKLYFLSTFYGVLNKLQTEPKFMADTLTKLNSLNWQADDIKDALFSLERQLHTPSTEEEKIIHDLYTINQIGAPSIAKAFELSSNENANYEEISSLLNQQHFQLLTDTGKKLGQEKLLFTQQFIQQLQKK